MNLIKKMLIIFLYMYYIYHKILLSKNVLHFRKATIKLVFKHFEISVYKLFVEMCYIC